MYAYLAREVMLQCIGKAAFREESWNDTKSSAEEPISSGGPASEKWAQRLIPRTAKQASQTSKQVLPVSRALLHVGVRKSRARSKITSALE